jgi:dTDP-4-dehydrorhamnose reductase
MLVNQEPIKILVLGANGMLGNAVFQFFSANSRYETYGSVRSQVSRSCFPDHVLSNVISGVDVENHDSLIRLFSLVRPGIVVNCVGIIKQDPTANDPLIAISINSLLPHRLAKICTSIGSRLIQIGTDCVFSGDKGLYREEDLADAGDLYGRSKLLGEADYPNTITLRTSIIGHELSGARSLIDWFLAQKGRVKGYRRAIFSGLPTWVVAQIIQDFVIPRPDLHGLYHLSAAPINKYDLLKQVGEIYRKDIQIIPDDQVVINRSLDSSRFQNATGYFPKSWPELIQLMYESRLRK